MVSLFEINSALFLETQELLASCKSVRAYVNKLDACTCSKGKGHTRKQRKLCDHCQALSGLKTMRNQIQKMKEYFRI